VFSAEGTEPGDPSVNQPHATESVSDSAGSPTMFSPVFAAAYVTVAHES
jgi:hypothetical protein